MQLAGRTGGGQRGEESAQRRTRRGERSVVRVQSGEWKDVGG